MKEILLVGLYDKNTTSLAPVILKAYAEKYAKPIKLKIKTKEYSIFSDNIEDIIKDINDEKHDVVGFSTYIWNFNIILKILKRIKAKIILGGPQVTGIEDELLQKNPKIDIIVSGEGEVTFKELVEYFSGKGDIKSIKGLTTKKIKTPAREPIRDLNTIPSVYEKIITNNPHITWLSYETSRGCPMRCKYCSWSYTKNLRYYPLDRVIKELKVIIKSSEINHIYFCDSNLLLNRPRAKNILNYLAKNRRTNQTIRFEFNAEWLDDELINLLGILTNGEFNFGIQSTNQVALKIVGRSFNQQKFEENYNKFLKKFPNAQITIDLIYGLPGDNINGYKESLNYIISLKGVDRILTNPLIILPGSELFENRKKYKIKFNPKNFLLTENYTFTAEEMRLARQYSFYVSIIYLNKLLRERIKIYAEKINVSYIETIIKLIESLPFDITGGLDYPDMIPSTREGFRSRNKVLYYVTNFYLEVIKFFNKFTNYTFGKDTNEYELCFTNHFYKLKKLANLNKR